MTIKETAGKLLLYLYELHRNTPGDMKYLQLSFDNVSGGGVKVHSDNKQLKENLNKINPSDSDIYTAFLFLQDKYFILANTPTKTPQVVDFYIGVRLTDRGVDVIEGIERGQEEKQAFNVTFNIKVDNNMNVESLVKANLSMLGLGL